VGGCAVTRHRTQPAALAGEPAPGSAGASAHRASRSWWADPSRLLAHCSAGGEPEEQKQGKLWVEIMMV